MEQTVQTVEWRGPGFSRGFVASAGDTSTTGRPEPAKAAGRPGEPRFFHFDTDVYERRIGLAVGPLKEMGAAWLTERIQEAWPDLDKEGRVELDDVDETVLADVMRIQTEDGKVIRIVRIPWFDGSPHDHSVLAHETFHLACGTLKDLGIPHDDHEEAHAYLFEYVYRRFLEFLFGRKHETP